MSSPNPVVFFDVAIAGRPVGRIGNEILYSPSAPFHLLRSLSSEMTLRSDVCPRTVENFRVLCTGEKSTPRKKLWFKDSIFHRVIPQFMIQGDGSLKGCCSLWDLNSNTRFMQSHRR